MPLPPNPEPPIRRLWQPYEPVEFKVRCERRMHRIRIDAEGRLTLIDHDMELEALAKALGGDEMRCPAVVDRFRESVKSGLVGRLPDKAKPHLHALRQRREDRRAWTAERQTLIWGGNFLAAAGVAPNPHLVNGHRGVPQPLQAFQWKAQRSKEAYLTRHIRRLLATTALPAVHPPGGDPYPTPHTIQLNLVLAQYPPATVQLNVNGRQGFGNRTALRGHLTISEHWWRRVHLAGMSVIDGRLVLDAPALGDDHGVVYSFAGMTPRAKARARRKARAQAEESVAQLPLPDILGETRTASVCVLGDAQPGGPHDGRWQLTLACTWYAAVAEKGAPWRLERPLETWQVPQP